MSHWTGPLSDPATKFRLRVGNEQIALAHGVTLIGRDASCRIAIVDTLVSRRHARIQCDLSSATIEDLDSRNGTRVNGSLIASAHVLREGDRIRIGSQELVFGVVDAEQRELLEVPTGLIHICPDCRTPYQASAPSCPSCGAHKRDTQPAQARSEDTQRGRWSLGLLVELLGKSMLTERVAEAEKLMREAANNVADLLREGRPIDDEELRALREASTWLAKRHKSDTWPVWMAGVEARLRASADLRSP